MGKKLDLIGQRFGRLTVEGMAGKDSSGHSAWLCRCDCGNSVVARGSHLKVGYIQSCGCIAVEQLRERSIKHGLEHTRIYRIWSSMLSRCYNHQNNRYHRYGGRGITVCSEWRDSVEAFRDWALSHGYQDHLTIDRVDNNGPYSPENCRWATYKDQLNHTSRNRYITIGEETKTVTQWAEAKQMKKSTIYGRIQRGWTYEKAITTPVCERGGR